MKKGTQARLRLAELGATVIDGRAATEPRRYAQSTSGRSDSHETFPADSRSIEMASDSPAGLPQYATLLRCPTVVSQRSAKDLRSSADSARQNARNSMSIYHHTVTYSATPFGVFTKRWKTGDNSCMGINELAEVRRANTRRLVVDRFEGNRSALARAYAKVVNKEAAPNLFSDLLREGSQKTFGEKLARRLEQAAGLKAGQLDIESSPLEMDERRRDRLDDSIRADLEELTTEEKQEVSKALKGILSKRTRYKRA